MKHLHPSTQITVPPIAVWQQISGSCFKELLVFVFKAMLLSIAASYTCPISRNKCSRPRNAPARLRSATSRSFFNFPRLARFLPRSVFAFSYIIHSLWKSFLSALKVFLDKLSKSNLSHCKKNPMLGLPLNSVRLEMKVLIRGLRSVHISNYSLRNLVMASWIFPLSWIELLSCVP